MNSVSKRPRLASSKTGCTRPIDHPETLSPSLVLPAADHSETRAPTIAIPSTDHSETMAPSKVSKLTESQQRIAQASASAQPASAEDPVLCLVPPLDFDPRKLSLETPHPLDAAVTFDEPTHTYAVQYRTNGPFCGEGIVSTSGFVHEFFEHFDPDTVIPQMRRGKNFASSPYASMTNSDIKELWAANGARASARGTLLHFLLECHLNGFDLAASPYAGLEDIQAYFRWRQSYFEPAGLVPFRTELRFSTGPELRLTGTADLIAIRDDHPPPSETGGLLSLHLIDWKFSKGVRQENAYRNGTGPCTVLPDCNGSHYALQQNLYRWFLETYHQRWTWRGHQYTSVKIVDMRLAIFHRNHGDSGLCVAIEDRSRIVTAMLDLRREQIARNYNRPLADVGQVLLRPVYRPSISETTLPVVASRRPDPSKRKLGVLEDRIRQPDTTRHDQNSTPPSKGAQSPERSDGMPDIRG